MRQGFDGSVSSRELDFKDLSRSHKYMQSAKVPLDQTTSKASEALPSFQSAKSLLKPAGNISLSSVKRAKRMPVLKDTTNAAPTAKKSKQSTILAAFKPKQTSSKLSPDPNLRQPSSGQWIKCASENIQMFVDNTSTAPFQPPTLPQERVNEKIERWFSSLPVQFDQPADTLSNHQIIELSDSD